MTRNPCGATAREAAQSDCDILVVGGGPAGSSAALAAAREGARVVVVDRRRVIGVPVQCAEYIPAMLLNEVPLDRDVLVQPIRALKTLLSGCRPEEMPAPGYTIRRDRFDQRLAASAEQAGARFLLSTAAVARRDAHTVELKHKTGRRLLLKVQVIIGADGPRSTVAKWAGLVQRNLIPAVQARVTLAQAMDATEVYLEPAFRAGYGWLFPKGREANAGLGFKPLRDADPSPGRLLQLFLERLKADGKIKGSAISYQTGFIPVEPAQTSVFGNTLLVGDAAGQTHPITGAGIFSAVVCGKMAGQWAARVVREKDHRLLQRYEDEWRDLFGETLVRASRRRRFMEANWTRFDQIIKSSWIAYRDYYAEPVPHA
ncbi:MAG: NAD(P)/FAD-dependent oxidoreductase [Deltaproteobacteria bacterium]|nr:NAD(P)/FAD-dependent oxidoreductase [Deltaproteobacteria bacterium]